MMPVSVAYMVFKNYFLLAVAPMRKKTRLSEGSSGGVLQSQ